MKRKKIELCEKCGHEIKDSPKYINNIKVCLRCFKLEKNTNRLKRCGIEGRKRTWLDDLLIRFNNPNPISKQLKSSLN